MSDEQKITVDDFLKIPPLWMQRMAVDPGEFDEWSVLERAFPDGKYDPGRLREAE